MKDLKTSELAKKLIDDKKLTSTKQTEYITSNSNFVQLTDLKGMFIFMFNKEYYGLYVNLKTKDLSDLVNITLAIDDDNILHITDTETEELYLVQIKVKRNVNKGNSTKRVQRKKATATDSKPKRTRKRTNDNG